MTKSIPSNGLRIEQFHNGRESAVILANRFLRHLAESQMQVISVFPFNDSICVTYEEPKMAFAHEVSRDVT